jgi:hypothetical protein
LATGPGGIWLGRATVVAVRGVAARLPEDREQVAGADRDQQHQR